jgi:hypothetical protein
VNYPGKGKARGENELDSLRFVAKELSLRESELYRTKWFDYRLMHHVEATRYWAFCYSEAVRTFCTLAHDASKSADLKTFDDRDALRTREASACVTARQGLDQIGCRYPWAMMWYVHRFSDRGWLAMPRPNQLYSEELLLDLRDAWAIECRASLQRPSAPVFRASGRAGMRSEYAEWAMDQAALRSSSGQLWMPLSTLLREGYLDPEHIESRFGTQTLARVRSALGHTHP